MFIVVASSITEQDMGPEVKLQHMIEDGIG